MKVKNISIEYEIDDGQQLHRIHLLDSNKRERIISGDWVQLDQNAFVIFENLHFVVIEGIGYIEYQSLVNYISGPKIVDAITDEVKTETNEYT